MFGDHLDGLTDTCRLLFVDQRAQGRSDPAPPETWTLNEMAADVERLANTLGLERYGVLGHSFGAFVALEHAVEYSGRPAASIISSGVPDASFLDAVQRNLQAFEPVELREQVTNSWAREAEAHTQEDCLSILSEQLPFHFRDPLDPRIDAMRAELGNAVYSPDVLRAAARSEYGAVHVQDRLPSVSHPVLVLAGRHDRTCSVAGAEAIAQAVPDVELVVFEGSGHMTFIEEQNEYVAAVGDFITRRALSPVV